MCGRVIQTSGPLNLAIVDGMNGRDNRVHNYPPRWNAAPSHDLLVIRRNHRTGEVSLDPLRWGLIPNWCNDPQGRRKPINAKCEKVHILPTFRDAYRSRRCILPVDGFYEWMALRGPKAKQPLAIAMKDGRPFGLGGIWENWKDPISGEWIRTFAIITTDANELVDDIHDRMPLILAPSDYEEWLSDYPDPRELMRPFPAGPKTLTSPNEQPFAGRPGGVSCYWKGRHKRGALGRLPKTVSRKPPIPSRKCHAICRGVTACSPLD